MKAMEIYQKLLNYENEQRKSNKYYYGLSNNICYIHHKGDENKYCVLYKSGRVIEHDIYEPEFINETHVSKLIGDDFELFNSVQFHKCGYLTIDGANSENDIKEVISKLYGIIHNHACGGTFWENGLTDHIRYFASNGVEVSLCTIKEICKSNVMRKHYGAQILPFIKYMKNSESLYISFTIDICNKEKRNKINELCNDALSECMTHLTNLGYTPSWTNCHMKKSIYH